MDETIYRLDRLFSARFSAVSLCEAIEIMQTSTYQRIGDGSFSVSMAEYRLTFILCQDRLTVRATKPKSAEYLYYDAPPDAFPAWSRDILCKWLRLTKRLSKERHAVEIPGYEAKEKGERDWVDEAIKHKLKLGMLRSARDHRRVSGFRPSEDVQSGKALGHSTDLK